MNDRKYPVLSSSSAPVSNESLVEASGPVTQKTTPTPTPTSAMSTPQNARKSIRTSTITRFSPIVAISSTQSADNSPSVQPATVKVASSTSPKGTEPIHSARKRRIITCNMPAPASKKVAALAQASGNKLLASLFFASLLIVHSILTEIICLFTFQALASSPALCAANNLPLLQLFPSTTLIIVLCDRQK